MWDARLGQSIRLLLNYFMFYLWQYLVRSKGVNLQCYEQCSCHIPQSPLWVHSFTTLKLWSPGWESCPLSLTGHPNKECKSYTSGQRQPNKLLLENWTGDGGCYSCYWVVRQWSKLLREAVDANPWKCSRSGRMGPWPAWSSGRHPCPWREDWNWMVPKVPFNPNHSRILWFLPVMH